MRARTWLGRGNLRCAALRCVTVSWYAANTFCHGLLCGADSQRCTCADDTSISNALHMIHQLLQQDVNGIQYSNTRGHTTTWPTPDTYSQRTACCWLRHVWRQGRAGQEAGQGRGTGFGVITSGGIEACMWERREEEVCKCQEQERRWW